MSEPVEKFPKKKDQWTDTKSSRALSKVLRHEAQKLGLAIRPDGFILVQDLVLDPSFFSDLTITSDLSLYLPTYLPSFILKILMLFHPFH